MYTLFSMSPLHPFIPSAFFGKRLGFISDGVPELSIIIRILLLLFYCSRDFAINERATLFILKVVLGIAANFYSVTIILGSGQNTAAAPLAFHVECYLRRFNWLKLLG